MGVAVRRYIDFLIILLIPTPLVLAHFWQQHPYFFVHFKNVFFVFVIIMTYAFIQYIHVKCFF